MDFSRYRRELKIYYAAAEKNLHGNLAELLRRYNVNDYAASVRVYAIKQND